MTFKEGYTLIEADLARDRAYAEAMLNTCKRKSVVELPKGVVDDMKEMLDALERASVIVGELRSRCK